MTSVRLPSIAGAGTLRIAVLLTNNDDSEFSRRYPNDGEKVRALLETQRPLWDYEVYAVKDGVFPEIGQADGYVITGSPASVNDTLPWIASLETLVRALSVQRVPLIGLCFGHQVIAKALGGCVAGNPGGWRFGTAETKFERSEPWMTPAVRVMRLHASHSEQVTRLPPGARLLGGDVFCPLASFSYGNHIFTTQYHPEFSHDFMVALADAYEGEVPRQVLEEGRRKLESAVDSDVFAQWAANFLAGGQSGRESGGRAGAERTSA